MNLPDILKQFKKIQPDAAFKEKSKRAVLAHQPKEKWSVRRTIIGIFETGVAIGLAVVAVFALTGKFSGTNYIAPVQFSVINPETLHAEAQDVDIQIQLANLTYQEGTAATGTGAVSTPQIAAAIIARKPALLLAEAVADASSTPSSTALDASSTPSSTLSVDQALQELSH